jgi:hypothetical protein
MRVTLKFGQRSKGLEVTGTVTYKQIVTGSDIEMPPYWEKDYRPQQGGIVYEWKDKLDTSTKTVKIVSVNGR